MLKILLFYALSAGLFSSVEAQRTRQLSNERTPGVASSNSRNNSSVARQATSRPAPIRSFTNENRTPQSRPIQNVSRGTNVRPQATSGPARNMTGINSSQRTIVNRNGYNSYNAQNRMINNYDRYNYRHVNYNYGNVYGRRTMFMYGPRYTTIPHSFISINFGGYPYYYNRGYYYGYYGGYYQPIFPPFGLQIRVLPFGYNTIFMNAIPYYYYNGIYYRQSNNYYEVVDAPMGASVSVLPRGARSVFINGEKLYELNGTYYKSDRDERGNDVFIVVGKNGVINNTADEQINQNLSPESLEIGSIISQLPEGSKVVTINGQQLYETPDHIYLQEETTEGNLNYKVIGK
ncbi:MAG: DUF6515 family protein [Ginsengibacter sp.]